MIRRTHIPTQATRAGLGLWCLTLSLRRSRGGKSLSIKLAEALLGKEGSSVTLGVQRDGEQGILRYELVRAPIATDTEVMGLHSWNTIPD